MCHNVTVVSPLLPLSGELIASFSAYYSNTARTDIHVRCFWGGQQGALFDIRVLHPNPPSYCQIQVVFLFC